MRRRTKIVATIGPASRGPKTLRAMLLAGVNVLRINFSHEHSDGIPIIQLAREIAAELKHPLAIMAELQGPKIRIGRFKNDAILLKNGQSFSLYCQAQNRLGDESGVAIDYPELCGQLTVGDRLLLDDGLIELRVRDIAKQQVECRVIEGGVLGSNKGINRKGGGLILDALTKKDKKDMALAVAEEVDYLCLSFVQNVKDIQNARKRLAKMGAADIFLISKIECTAALINLEAIIKVSDAVMVARGDLGVEVGAAEVPAIQKNIIKQARQLNKIVITATQMMESMIQYPQPTRAEVSDVANAVLDGTDAVMLSAETATGLYPVQVIEMVDKTCRSAEKNGAAFYPFNSQPSHSNRPDKAIAMASMHVANHFPIDAIVALTESGATAIWMSRIHSMVPIYAVSANPDTVSKLNLVSNVFPFFYDYQKLARSDIKVAILTFLLEIKCLSQKASVLLTHGSVIGKVGGTSNLEIISLQNFK